MPTEKKFSWPMNWCRNLSQAAFWHASGTSTSFWNTQSNWGERPGKSPPVFGIFQRRPSSCCKKGFVRLRFFSVNFLLLLQGPLSAPSSRPTRFLTTLDPLEVGYPGLHKLDAQGNYLGPLPKQCPHGPNAHKALVGKDEEGRWITAPSATYPPELCKWIAEMAWPALLRLRGGRANHGENWGSSNPNSRGSDRRKRGGQLSWKTTRGPSRAPGDANGM